MLPNVLLTHRLLPEAQAFLEARTSAETLPERALIPAEEIRSRLADKDGLLCFLTDPIDRSVIEAGRRLRVIANCAVGVNNIDVAYAVSRGILVTNTPGVLTDATADLAWALILATTRRIPQADRFTREGRFLGWRLDLFLGLELNGRTLGIIGLGRIGRAVARRAAPFGLKIVYFDRVRLSPGEEASLGAEFLPLDELLAVSDIVTIHASLSPESRGMLSAGRLAKMKPTAVLINTARGPLVDERALAAALAEGRLWGAGLDVYEREPEVEKGLLGLDNVVLLPHIASATLETRSKMAMMAARSLIQALEGRTPDNLVKP
jgi:glyoxylate reductase